MKGIEWIVSLPSLIVIGIFGMFIHFAKKNIRGETATEVRDFFRDNFKSTVIALGVTVLSVILFYATIATGQAADIVIALMNGYTFDSAFNKWSGESSETKTNKE
jgi:hypothetical protein